MAPALDGVEALLLDLSGVIYVQDEAVPGATEALSEFRERGIPMSESRRRSSASWAPGTASSST